MLKIGKIELGKIPRVAVTISDREDNQLIKALFIDILEIRVDQFKNTEPAYVQNVIKKRKKIGLPLILTVRSHAEGGQKDLSDELKLSIFKENIPLVDAVDIELKSPVLSEVIRSARRNKKMVIVSWHNLKATPNDRILQETLDKAKRSGAHLVKIAVKANKAEDLNRLMRWTIENRSKNIITISLGKIGSISRLIFPGLGSLLTYAYIDKPSGLGQRQLEELRGHLRAYYPQVKSAS